jgi:hypothetical protein
MIQQVASAMIGILDLKNCSRAPQTESIATSAPLQSYTPPEHLQKKIVCRCRFSLPPIDDWLTAASGVAIADD